MYTRSTIHSVNSDYINQIQSKCPSQMSFTRATLPLFYLYKICGLTTISLDWTDRLAGPRYLSRPNTVFDYLYCFTVLAALQVACLGDILSGSLEKDVALNIARYYEAICTPLVVLFAMAINFRYKEDFVKMLREEEEIQQLMTRHGRPVRYRIFRRVCYFELLFIAVIFFIACVVRTLLEQDFRHGILRMLSYELSDFAFVLALSMCANVMLMLKHRISCARILLLHAGPNESQFILAAMRLYSSSYQRAWMAQRALSRTLLVSLAMVFQTVVTQGYALYRHIYAKNAFEMAECTKWITIAYLELAIVVYPAERIKREAMLCGQILHRITPRLLKSSQDADSHVTPKLLVRSSLQLLHEPITFSAAGFFTVDFTLAYNITAAAAMYLIILMQFDVGRNSLT